MLFSHICHSDSFILYCLQINVAEDVGEITKVRVGFIDPSKIQKWHLLKVGDKILLLFLHR